MQYLGGEMHRTQLIKTEPVLLLLSYYSVSHNIGSLWLVINPEINISYRPVVFHNVPREVVK